MALTFHKNERLCGSNAIARLFNEGSVFICFPFRVLFLIEPVSTGGNDAKILISVSKKRFKRANKRNRIKRLIRESYRLNKTGFNYIANTSNVNLTIGFQYISNDVFNFDKISDAVKSILLQLSNKIIDNEHITPSNS